MIDFPLLKTFEVDSSFVNFLNKKFSDYIEENSITPASGPIYLSETGGHTKNLVEWENEEYQTFLNTTLLDLISKQLNLNKSQVKIHYNHFFDYNEGGEVKIHNHSHSEDFVIFVYTKTCDSGHTVFYLNSKEEFRKRTVVRLKPTFGLCACFSSSLFHFAEYTDESKRIFVIGVRINLE